MTLLDDTIWLITSRRLCIDNIPIIDNMVMSGVFCSERFTQILYLIDNTNTYRNRMNWMISYIQFVSFRENLRQHNFLPSTT